MNSTEKLFWQLTETMKAITDETDFGQKAKFIIETTDDETEIQFIKRFFANARFVHDYTWGGHVILPSLEQIKIDTKDIDKLFFTHVELNDNMWIGEWKVMVK